MRLTLCGLVSALVLHPAAALAAVNLSVPAKLTMSTAYTVISDPVNGTRFPKSIPGSVMSVSITVSNEGIGFVDHNAIVVDETIPPDMVLFVGDFGASGTGPVQFVDGIVASGLHYAFATLASPTDSISFSDNAGLSYAYTPAPDAQGYDDHITNFRITPTGMMHGAVLGDTSFGLNFRMRLD